MINETDEAMATPEEARRDRFLRVAERRTKEILHKLRLLGNCSNKSAYSYSPAEVDEIFDVIGRLLNMGLGLQGVVRRREDIEIAMEERMMEIIPNLEKRTPYVALASSIATPLKRA